MLTRARAADADLFTWLKTLYPVWARIDDEMEYAAARWPGGARALRLHDRLHHHYVFRAESTGLVEAEVRAPRVGLRIAASRGSMDLGESDGGLPPDALAEE